MFLNQKHILFVFTCLWFFTLGKTRFQCIKNNEKFSFDTQTKGLGIGLQVTSRPTHQVMTRIFYMFLKEVLNYRQVQIIPLHYPNSSDSRTSWDTLDYVRNYKGYHNISMINLEVWLPVTIYRNLPENILNAGASITPGRFSWFVPKTQISPDQDNYLSLHYAVFRGINNDYYKLYVLEDDITQLLRSRSVAEYMNPICEGIKCATLIAELPSDTSFIKVQLKEIYVNVIWLGSKFVDTVRELTSIYEKRYPVGSKRFIVLHWMPSEIIDAEIKFSQITLPRCEEFKYLQEFHCKYELMPILKYYSRSLLGDSRLVYALQSFYISDKDLADIQKDLRIQRNKSVDSEQVYNQVACNWLHNNENIYKSWILKNGMTTLSIGGIFPINQTDRGHHNIIGAAQRAVEAVNQNKTILPGYQLQLLVNDGQCKSDMVMKAFIHYFNSPNMLGVLGPACSETVEPIAGISKHMNMLDISYSAEGANFVDRKSYPYIFSTIGSNIEYVDAYMEIMRKLGWSRVSTLTEDGQQYGEYMAHMERKLKLHGYALAFSKTFSNDIVATDMREQLLKLRESHSRIIIAELNWHNAALALCEAIHLGMTQTENYVWFLPSWLSKDFELWQTRVESKCSAKQFQTALNGHLSLRHTPFGQPAEQLPTGERIGSWLSSYRAEYGNFSNYVGFVYDAVWAYAIAAHKLLQSDANAANNLRSKQVVGHFAKLMWETDFQGLSGSVRFGQGEFGGSRIIDVDILQWKNMTYTEVGKFKPNILGNGSDVHMNGGILLLNPGRVFPGEIPEDGRYDCRYASLAQALSVNCEMANMIFSLCICLLFIALMSLISYYFWKQRYNRKVEHSAKIMKMFGIDLLSPSRTKINTLDKWEIQRDNVVVNRKIGQGVFGTVFGGEARLDAENWTAVAVKTLKNLMTADDRLDFLAEAEAMKKFDHKNIVKLLGVCLQEEPIYTIMEFMLYGDLKTYLLARRNMANEKCTDESDVSPKRLTMYAMDIARGLAYLAEQKYVHRDIACRNCLINAQRVVKIGDFGMARPTFESDYYCFNRKGVRKLFPVRWMPPETLSIGLFTSASDIWSFGVVLYEIITFGSYPFQGLTNSQVLDYVRCGNTLQIPSGAKPQLEGLLKACWSQDSSKRPTAPEVIEYISSYARLLTPCLDCPETAVHMPETESEEMEMLLKGCMSSSLIHHQSSLDILPRINGSRNMDFKSISKEYISETVADADSGTVSMPPCNSGSFSPITPDGYSIMSPLLMHQVGTNSNSSK